MYTVKTFSYPPLQIKTVYAYFMWIEQFKKQFGVVYIYIHKIFVNYKRAVSTFYGKTAIFRVNFDGIVFMLKFKEN